MKQTRLMWTVLAVLVVGASAAFALACGKATKSATATTASTHAACSAEMAANCTPEMAATCGTQGTAAANASGCAMHGAATTADMKAGQCPYMSKGAMAGKTAAHDAASCAMHGAAATTASAGDCAAHGAAATTASASGCSMHGTAATTAMAASAGGDCCAPGAKGAKAAKLTKTAGVVSAVPVGGPACGTHSSSAAMAECDACADMMSCESDIAEAGGKVQIVPLKNGVMYVYSAESSARVRAVQAAVARHAERVTAMSASNDKAHLCTHCKEMRGAAASGKLTREVVNIESGCLTLLTSNDPRIVTELYSLAGLQGGSARAATKS